jgi:hypothetical protein
MSLRLTQGDENQGQIEWYRRNTVFDRAVNGIAKPGFSRWGTVFSVPVDSLPR